RIPKYRLHKPTRLAVVRLSGRDVYLGPYGSSESEAKYEAVVAEWLKRNRKPPPRPKRSKPKGDLVVNELSLAYIRFAKKYYVKNGELTGEIQNIRDALRLVSQRYGSRRVASFGASQLKKIRDEMVTSGLCRNVINARINRIRRMFKWGVENDKVETEVLNTLQAVAPLRKGRSPARETDPVGPVSDHLVDAVLEYVPRQIAAMIRLQRFTGMRPGEATQMRTGDIDMSGRIWAYRPASHKTEHHGRSRVIYVGPQAQQVLGPFLKPDLKAYIFSPREVVEELRQERRRKRKTRETPSEKAKRARGSTAQYGDKYTRRSYAQAIKRGCAKVFPPPDGLSEQERLAWVREHQWSPNQLRHNAATLLRKQFGLEAARAVLGHSSAVVTELYAEFDEKKAADIMDQVG
ncbi:MAG: site-specific integrase, partial [Phycisphaerae bacterium]